MQGNANPVGELSRSFSVSRVLAASPVTSDLKRSKMSRTSSRMSNTSRRSTASVMPFLSGYAIPVTIERGKELYAAKKFRPAYTIFDKLAQSKDVAAMYYKSVMLLDGLGIPESNREGLLALKKTYEKSVRTACDPKYQHLSCYQIGLAYFRGMGARQDLNEAVRWWLKAANEVKYDPSSQIAFENQINTESGTLCQILLAKHYATRRPNPDWEKSYNWYKEAAQNGSIESLFQVGVLTWYGLGCDPAADEKKTHETIQTFLGQAAVGGNVCAMANLAFYCLQKQLQEGAFLWATKAIETVKGPTGKKATLAEAVKKVMAMPNNDNDVESVTKAISMAYFVLAHLHNVGAVASEDKEKAGEFFEAASDIDLGLVHSLTKLLESELAIKHDE
ncbi:putative LRP2-binding protein [Hypsibius exemplaris]|nr:putative LRP2-binding protein [Hypsibius exemplaris]